MNADQLNAAAALIGTTDKNAVLNVCVAALVKSGMSVDVALDTVCGAGTYENFVSELYAKLVTEKTGLRI